MDTLLQSKLAKIAIVIALLVFIIDAVISCSRQDQVSESIEYRGHSVNSVALVYSESSTEAN